MEKVNGLPVLVHLDSEPVQRELTRAVQNSHCELLKGGITKHPLNTMPIIIGNALPAENAIFALDWPTFENANPAHVAVLRNAFRSLMKDAERQRRFAMALDIVRDIALYDSLVAPDASEMTPEQLGFRYTDSQGDTFIAFELKEDFPKFMTRRLGLRAGDSVEFRRYLVQNGIMNTVSKNVRSRSQDSIFHALICLSIDCETGE